MYKYNYQKMRAEQLKIVPKWLWGYTCRCIDNTWVKSDRGQFVCNKCDKFSGFAAMYEVTGLVQECLICGDHYLVLSHRHVLPEIFDEEEKAERLYELCYSCGGTNAEAVSKEQFEEAYTKEVNKIADELIEELGI